MVNFTCQGGASALWALGQLLTLSLWSGRLKKGLFFIPHAPYFFSLYLSLVPSIKVLFLHLPEDVHKVLGLFVCSFYTIHSPFNPPHYKKMEKVIINHQVTKVSTITPLTCHPGCLHGATLCQYGMGTLAIMSSLPR